MTARLPVPAHQRQFRFPHAHTHSHIPSNHITARNEYVYGFVGHALHTSSTLSTQYNCGIEWLRFFHFNFCSGYFFCRRAFIQFHWFNFARLQAHIATQMLAHVEVWCDWRRLDGEFLEGEKKPYSNYNHNHFKLLFLPLLDPFRLANRSLSFRFERRRQNRWKCYFLSFSIFHVLPEKCRRSSCSTVYNRKPMKVETATAAMAATQIQLINGSKRFSFIIISLVRWATHDENHMREREREEATESIKTANWMCSIWHYLCGSAHH